MTDDDKHTLAEARIAGLVADLQAAGLTFWEIAETLVAVGTSIGARSEGSIKMAGLPAALAGTTATGRYEDKPQPSAPLN